MSSVQESSSPRSSSPSTPWLYSVYVGNLDLGVDKESLYNIFSKYGDIGGIFIQTMGPKDTSTYGFVRFFEECAANVAVQHATYQRIMYRGRFLVVSKSRTYMCKQKNYYNAMQSKRSPSRVYAPDPKWIEELKDSYLRVKADKEFKGLLPEFDEILSMISVERPYLAPATKYEFEGFTLDLAKINELASSR